MKAVAFGLHALDRTVETEAAIALAALPLSLTVGEHVRGAIALVSGADDWARRASAAIEAGAIGVVVTAPTLHDPPDRREELARLARRSDDVPVLLHCPFLDNPSVVLPEARRMAVGAASVVSDRFLRADGAVLAALFDHLGLVRMFVGPLRSVSSAVVGRGGYSVSAALASGSPVLLGGIASDHEEIAARVRILRPPHRLYAEIPSGVTSRSARIVLTAPDCDRTMPSDYESPWRVAMRRLLRSLHDRSRPRDVIEYLDDLRVLDEVRRTHRESGHAPHE